MSPDLEQSPATAASTAMIPPWSSLFAFSRACQWLSGCWSRADVLDPKRVPPALVVCTDSPDHETVSPVLSAGAEANGCALTVLPLLPSSAPDNDARAHGRVLADELIDAGTPLLLLTADAAPPADEAEGSGVLSVADEALAILGRTTGYEPVALLGPRPVTQWRRDVAAIRRLMFAARTCRGNALKAAAAMPAARMLTLIGFVERCVERRRPVITGGIAPLVATVALQQVDPDAAAWIRHAAAGHDPAMTLAVEETGKAALLSAPDASTDSVAPSGAVYEPAVLDGLECLMAWGIIRTMLSQA